MNFSKSKLKTQYHKNVIGGQDLRTILEIFVEPEVKTFMRKNCYIDHYWEFLWNFPKCKLENLFFKKYLEIVTKSPKSLLIISREICFNITKPSVKNMFAGKYMVLNQRNWLLTLNAIFILIAVALQMMEWTPILANIGSPTTVSWRMRCPRI